MKIEDRLAEIVKEGAALSLPIIEAGDAGDIPLWSAEILPTDPTAVFWVVLGAEDQSGCRFRAFSEMRIAGMGIEFDTLPTGAKMWICPVSDIPDMSTDRYQEDRRMYAAGTIDDPATRQGFLDFVERERRVAIGTVSGPHPE